MTTTEAQTILTMLEAVNDDTPDAVEREINARFWCFVKEFNYVRKEKGRYWHYYNTDDCSVEMYTDESADIHDRNALKAVRVAELEGWTWVANTQDAGCHFNFYSPNPDHMRRLSRAIPSDYLHTEEIAELWAIVAAIDWKRENDG